ncbi:hypothetical protein FQA39_LY06483 [Lamprigera yunnana]|nr:hypothetical protein FQA39_LY06483 [Lamprigera yunnana]
MLHSVNAALEEWHVKRGGITSETPIGSLLKITLFGQAAKIIIMYKYSEQLSFLKNRSFEERELIVTLKVMKSDVIHSTPDENEERPQFGPPRNSSKRKITKAENQQTVEFKLMEYIILKNKEEKLLQPQHPVDTFLARIAATLNTLSPYHLHLAKSEIFNTVQKYEYLTVMGEQHKERTPNAKFVCPSSSTSTQYSSIDLTQNSVFQPGQEHTVQQFHTFQSDVDDIKY